MSFVDLELPPSNETVFSQDLEERPSMTMLEEGDSKVVGESDVVAVEGSSFDESNGLDRIGVGGGRSILVEVVPRSWRSSFGWRFGESKVEFCSELVDESRD